MKMQELLEASTFLDHGPDPSTDKGFDLEMMGLALKHLDVKTVMVTPSHVWVIPHNTGLDLEIYVFHHDTDRTRYSIKEGEWQVETASTQPTPSLQVFPGMPFNDAVNKVKALVKAHYEDK